MRVEPPPPFGLMVSRFVPRPASRLVMFEVVPWPTPTRATTEATPMMTPSIVSAARSRLVRSRESEQAEELAEAHATTRPVAQVDLPVGGPRRPRRRG